VLIKIGLDPVLFTIGGLKVHWYGIMIAVGLYVGIQVALRDSERRGIKKDQLMNLALLAAVLGIAGGRLYYVVQNNPSFFLHHPSEIIAVWQGGMAFFGALFCGALAVAISYWRWRLPFWSVLDVGALGVTIGQAIGRIGNIINGDIVGSQLTAVGNRVRQSTRRPSGGRNGGRHRSRRTRGLVEFRPALLERSRYRKPSLRRDR